MTTTTVSRNLSKGSTGEDVQELQIKLSQFYGPILAVDGEYGSETERVVIRFQGECTLAVDGVVGEQTWCYLNDMLPYVRSHQTPLRKGDQGNEVKYIQARLNGYFAPRETDAYQSLAADGNFGSKTETEVKRFQALVPLKPDGIVGSKTWQALERATINFD